jgi:cathepsin B
MAGVYVHEAGTMLGYHSVKLVGWGATEEGVEYWWVLPHAVLCGCVGSSSTSLCNLVVSSLQLPCRIAVNSWNTHWGTGGFFLIQRGVNEVCRVAFLIPLLIAGPVQYRGRCCGRSA